MNRYSYRTEGFLKLLPGCLKGRRMSFLLEILLSPLKYIYSIFVRFKDEKLKRLSHNGQVYSLRKIIREYCGDERCEITDGEYVNEIMMPYGAEGRLVNYQVNVPYDGNVNPQVNVTYAGLGQIRQNDFIVRLPEELQGDIDEAGLRAMIDGYKIAGKEYEIIYCL